MTVLTSAPVRRRAAGGWVVVGVVLLVVAAAVAVISSIAQLPAQGLLDPESVGPDGSRAVVQILQDRGVEVESAHSLDVAVAAIGADSTLVLTDATVLSDEALVSLTGLAADVILVDPRARDMRVLFDGAAPAGIGDGRVDPGCNLPDAQRAGAISPGATFTAPAGAIACYPSGGGHGLLVDDTASGRISAVDGTVLFTNQHLADDGNASLALNLMGRHGHLVWYVPNALDDASDEFATVGELTPDWVTPAIVLLIVAALAAAVWKGRRFGPLVAETLPVTVRADETTAGRARLYARSGDPSHAADALRIAALRRLARRLSLGPAASVRETVDAVAARLSTDPRTVADILIGRVPQTDRDLVDLADQLRDLELAVSPTAVPKGPRP
ncbi:DUF4350 domain-containing protein [Microbacterium invictum]|uniref:DUF4350 domain-containing protein n=1 Tax=Microbacterium invictum TaxID=515415 RepID=A0AA40VMX0_9MICO|nr:MULTISPECIES: DUF4350 domain-containing protein [Microbacterium]MBB4139728.1 hypothetical protein [Microbacterium invictum]